MITNFASTRDKIAFVLENIIDEIELTLPEENYITLKQDSKVFQIGVDSVQRILAKLEVEFHLIKVNQLCGYLRDNNDKPYFSDGKIEITDKTKLYIVFNNLIKHYNLGFRKREPLNFSTLLSNELISEEDDIAFKLSLDADNNKVILNDYLVLKGFYNDSENLDMFKFFIENPNKEFTMAEIIEGLFGRKLTKDVYDIARGWGLSNDLMKAFFIRKGKKYMLINPVKHSDLEKLKISLPIALNRKHKT